MDTTECQPLYNDIQEFYESMGMKVEQKIPLLLVERQALNEARNGETNVRKKYFKGKVDLCFFLFLVSYFLFSISFSLGPLPPAGDQRTMPF